MICVFSQVKPNFLKTNKTNLVYYTCCCYGATNKMWETQKSIDFYPIWNGVITVDTGVNYMISYNVDLILHLKTPKIDNSRTKHIVLWLQGPKDNTMSNSPLFQRRLLQYGPSPGGHLHDQSICLQYLCRLLLEEQGLSPPTNSWQHYYTLGSQLILQYDPWKDDTSFERNTISYLM